VSGESILQVAGKTTLLLCDGGPLLGIKEKLELAVCVVYFFGEKIK
jgi:hypothetical protein